MSFTKENSLKVKGIGVLLLIFHHLFFYQPRFDAYGVVPWALTVDQLVHVATAARVCVWIFVFVSAYGIATLYQNRVHEGGTLVFVFERWFSLMKGFWLIYVLVLAVLLASGRKGFDFYESNPLYLLLDWAGLADLFGTPVLSGAWWYMSYAQVMIILMPACIELCRKFGWVSFLMMFVLLQYLPEGIVSSSGGAYSMYLCGQILGILCAQNDFFQRFRKPKGICQKAAVLLLLCFAAVALVELRFWLVSEAFSYQIRHLNWILYGIAAVLICAVTVVVDGKWVNKVLSFLGKHSGNMFFIHMFFVYYGSGIVFATKSVVGSWMTLVLLSLGASVLVEALKKVTRYDALMDRLGSRMVHMLGENR